MRISIKLQAGLEKKVNSAFKDTMGIDEGKTVGELLKTIGIQDFTEVIVTSGRKVLPEDLILEDGDKISIYTNLIGG